MKKLFEPGNKMGVGHGRPKGGAAFAAGILDVKFGDGRTREVHLWEQLLSSSDEDVLSRALFRLTEWKYGKASEHVDVTSNGDPIRFGGDEGRAAIAAMLEGLQLDAGKPKAIEAKATKPEDGRPN
jgi:hypothetical protein